MSFNPNSTKQAQELLFSRKLKKYIINFSFLMENLLFRLQKYLGMILDSKSSFHLHLKSVMSIRIKQ